MALTDIMIRNAKTRDKQYKISDSGGLYVLMHPNGSKYWRLKYRIAGKEKVLSIGTYPLVSLAAARDKAMQAKEQLLSHIDPSLAKKEKKLQAKTEVENSFERVARCWHENQKHGWTERHANYVLRRMEADIFPALKAPELLAVLRGIEARGAIDIAHRAVQTCGQIFRYAIATGRAERDIAADLRGALKTRKKENHSHLLANELPEFMQKLENYDGDMQTKLALKFLILTFVRTGEVRGARWAEVDLDKKEWRIPAERMKMRDPHIVPLSDQALEVLRGLREMNGCYEYVLPNRNRPSTFISENTMFMLYIVWVITLALRRMDLELPPQLF